MYRKIPSCGDVHRQHGCRSIRKGDLLGKSRPSTLIRALDNTRVETSSTRAGERGTGRATLFETTDSEDKDPHLPIMKEELPKASKSSNTGYELVIVFKSHRDVRSKSQAMGETIC